MTKNQNLNKMFETLSDTDEQNTHNNSIKKQRKTNALLVAGTSIMLIAGLAGALALFAPKSQTTIQKANSIQTNVATKNDVGTSESTVKYPDWAYSQFTDKRYKEDVINSLNGTKYENMIVNYPSEKDGFTSESSKELIDGLPNLYYTTATQEDIRYATLSYVNRIINPVYGGWLAYQYGSENDPKGIPTVLYEDMFSDNFLANNELPFKMDIAKNDFGEDWDNIKYYTTDDKEKEFRYLPRWIGKILSIDDMKVDNMLSSIEIKGKYVMVGHTKPEKKEETYLFSMKLSVSKLKSANKNKIVVEEWSTTKE